MTPETELNEIIASFVTNKGEVEVIRLSHSNIPTRYLSYQLPDGTKVIDEDGNEQQITFAPLSLSEESSGSVLLNERDLIFNGINDLVSQDEDLIPIDSSEKIKVDVFKYIVDLDGNLSNIASGPIRYFNQSTSYSQKSNACSLRVSTTPTNNSETGEKITSAKYPTIRGFE